MLYVVAQTLTRPICRLHFRHSGRSGAETRNRAARGSAKLSRTPLAHAFRLRCAPAPPCSGSAARAPPLSFLLPLGEGGPQGRMRVGWRSRREPSRGASTPGGRPSPFRARTTAKPPCAQALSHWERVTAPAPSPARGSPRRRCQTRSSARPEPCRNDRARGVRRDEVMVASYTVPSPIGRRWPGGPDEGRMAQSA
jgi:hypothetical protein